MEGYPTEELQHDIARNLRGIRYQKELSLDQVAELTSVSKSMLAQIENGKSNPTISTLWKIATGLQVSFSMLTKKEEHTVRKVSASSLQPVIDNDGNYLVYSLFPFDPIKKFEMYLTRLKTGCTHCSERHAGEEYLLISSGLLRVSAHGKTYTLSSGDAVTFSANGPHRYETVGKDEAVFFTMIFYPD
ncbi:MAG: XRE family transcriptional regulator [Sporolactobacillus sp.]